MDLFAPGSPPPSLPMPTRDRWQPLRLGLVELYHYDSEEFWFRDGHLLLRGNNGTGKSKVLSLTLPLLFDAQLKSSRVEPDGDASKKMAWNLLMGSYDRRIGYAWIEFGRIASDGTPRYVSLGVGLSAVASRPQVDSWFFLLDDKDGSARLNQGLWLTSPQRLVLTKDRLRDAIDTRGQVFETAAGYRRAVDERLFHLGARRYDALIDTLIQLRQPQLSRKPDETALSNALTEALPPLATELLGDVAEALGQLEEDRRQLDDYLTLAKAVTRFEHRYRLYAGTQTRRQARLMRQAQTDFDTASRARTDTHAQFERRLADESAIRTKHEASEVLLAGARARQETLRSDPIMQDANRLESAEAETAARQQAVERAVAATQEADRRLSRSMEELSRTAQRMDQAERLLVEFRQKASRHADEAGIAKRQADALLIAADTAALVRFTRREFDRGAADLRALIVERREQIATLRLRHDEVARAESVAIRRQETRNERQVEMEDAAERRTLADREVDIQGTHLIERFDQHVLTLRQLRIDPERLSLALTALAEWVGTLDGDNPARQLYQSAHMSRSIGLAGDDAAIAARRQRLTADQSDLDDERTRLEAGDDLMPPLPLTRDPAARQSRAGAPFWQLVDFRETVTTAQRAGLEAALQASGVLDAWMSPDGRIQAKDGTPVHDTQIFARSSASPSLSEWMVATVPDGCDVSPQTVEQMLSGIGRPDAGLADDLGGACDVVIGDDGRFRVGALVGMWGKQNAVFIGHAARADARARRLVEITKALDDIAQELAQLLGRADQLAADRAELDEELRQAPTDDLLRTAHATAGAAARHARLASERLTEAELLSQTAERMLRDARERLAADAADLRLPVSALELPNIDTALDHYRDTTVRLEQTAHELRLAVPEWQRHIALEAESRSDLTHRIDEATAARLEAEQASARLDVLRQMVGARVEDLQRQLAEAKQDVIVGEKAVKEAIEGLRQAGEARAVAREQAEAAHQLLTKAIDARAYAVARLQQFTATGLLAAALPLVVLPDMDVRWTMESAVTLARRAEQDLSDLRDDDESWSRIQKQIAEELTELQRSLSALGHQAQAETSDWGLSVDITYQNRRERPDRLKARLDDEIAQRTELLSTTERAVLENHLQAEIASEIQRLLQAAERQVHAINEELHKRPTSTGVRYRLVWQALSEDEGAPIGLIAARKRLFNTSADLWSAEDRTVIGTMLQHRIAAERERADAAVGRDSGGSLLDQLARALDYRHWHNFRVERWQDGHWRKLAGPASSGERALGLTVPLFAAVASFYSQGSNALAPRLMLLDEAFAGIDDTARAHCMALIREFDLDFVITSEREWACYAELPGVSICQLQRREGIDAVFVSRWSWNGREKLPEVDPDRRFAPE